jgi:hypothetical protein
MEKHDSYQLLLLMIDLAGNKKNMKYEYFSLN